YDKLYYVQNATGPVRGPLESYLCTRGLKTLELRVREQSRVAAQLAHWLSDHPSVARGNYSGRAGHPGQLIAARRLGGAVRAMRSFDMKGAYEAATRLIERTKRVALAVRLGAVESLHDQPASMSHASYKREDRLAVGISAGLIRVSVGLEASEDLRDDLD